MHNIGNGALSKKFDENVQTATTKKNSKKSTTKCRKTKKNSSNFNTTDIPQSNHC
jgi:hypothetical protein